MNVPVPHQHHVLTLCAGADSLLMESSRRVVGAGKRKGLNPVKQVLVQPHEANNTSTETSTRLTDSPEKEAATKRSREAIASTPLDLSVSKAEFGGRRKQVRAHLMFPFLHCQLSSPQHEREKRPKKAKDRLIKELET